MSRQIYNTMCIYIGFITTDAGKAFSIRRLRETPVRIFEYRDNKDVYTNTDRCFFRKNIDSGEIHRDHCLELVAVRYI
jgi:hypothetical protein